MFVLLQTWLLLFGLCHDGCARMAGHLIILIKKEFLVGEERSHGVARDLSSGVVCWPILGAVGLYCVSVCA